MFVTGSSGFIGSAVTGDLVKAGHEVIGLARSDESAEAVRRAGGTPVRGSLEDLESLRMGAGQSDGVVNLGFNHDFSRFENSVRVELEAIGAMGEVLKGTGRPFVIASGGPTLSETTDVNARAMPRMSAAAKAIELARDGVRTSVVRLAPCVHDGSRCGFISMLVDIAERTGVSGYAGDGENRWCAVHRLDAAQLFCMALEKAPGGSVFQAVADEGIPLKVIAEKIGGHLGVPVKSIAEEEIDKHFGWLGRIVRADLAASSVNTRKQLGWQPAHPGLLYNLDHGHFFDVPR